MPLLVCPAAGVNLCCSRALPATFTGKPDASRITWDT